MHKKLIFRTSKEYIAKSLFKGALFWVAFNIITGLLTGDNSLNDNYFILFLIVSYVAFLASYKIKIDRGHITTYQAAMVTNNINLYKASEVVNEKDRVTVIYPDDSRFPIKYARFSEPEQIKVLEIAVPQSGDRPNISPVILEQHERKRAVKRSTGYTQNIIGGLSLTILGVVALFTDIIYMPGRNGFIYLEKEPTYFYSFLAFLFIFGIGSLLYGSIGKRKNRNTQHNLRTGVKRGTMKADWRSLASLKVWVIALFLIIWNAAFLTAMHFSENANIFASPISSNIIGTVCLLASIFAFSVAMSRTVQKRLIAESRSENFNTADFYLVGVICAIFVIASFFNIGF